MPYIICMKRIGNLDDCNIQIISNGYFHIAHTSNGYGTICRLQIESINFAYTSNRDGEGLNCPRR